ncbi:ORF6N domain-containing protein [Mucilaginibacter conchicola]|uniref:ORF6N domain-containing protein n=1 Tax=Mucilaginibacter conchicola TaxID=2303333 RepID=UPI001F2665D4|nr:ORF6N domain-containing protein [Mucilaginibacter conchicola]
MTNQTEVASDAIIAGKIVRNRKVMFDRDLADLYNVPTGQLKRAVRRNIKRFPNDFMFQLTQEEFKNLIFQNGTSNWGVTRKLPYVFTEQGVTMLSGILNSERAISVNIQIMRISQKCEKYFSITQKSGLSLKRSRPTYPIMIRISSSFFSIWMNFLCLKLIFPTARE